MSNSSDVSAGDDILASAYNDLRADVLNTSTGHTHNGVDSKSLHTMDYDRFSIKIQSGSDTGTSGSVTFDIEFPATPKIIICAKTTGSINFVYAPTVTNESTTGFDWTFPDTDVGIYWIAIYTP